ncbi:hypothetical protein [Psychroflexus lacisalsi]|uniref:Uncharacterized protein n=1 Tax=Psychroflexus lacisalsi TaxID=503928 RepID=A0ABN1K1F5_9FLAO|nr:hypothetical protein [Psychroflexus lacisalsi]MBZ9620840.1 hypothetical protein [Psychroflexus lacisalsi]
MNLITCLACLKNDLNIGFYKSIDIEITELTRYRSNYQNDIINYNRNSNNAQYKVLENKLFKMMLNKHEVITDIGLKEELEKLT